jgi:hypothetical protein
LLLLQAESLTPIFFEFPSNGSLYNRQQQSTQGQTPAMLPVAGHIATKYILPFLAHPIHQIISNKAISSMGLWKEMLEDAARCS